MIDMSGMLKLDFYRFLIILGFFLIVLCLVVPEYLEYKWYEKSVLRQADLNILEIQKNMIDNAIKINDAKDQVAIDALKLSSSLDADTLIALQQIETSENINSKKLLDLNKNIEALIVDEKMDNFYNSKRREYSTIRWFGVVVGGFLITFGMWHWRNNQAAIDQILLNKARDA